MSENEMKPRVTVAMSMTTALQLLAGYEEGDSLCDSAVGKRFLDALYAQTRGYRLSPYTGEAEEVSP